MEIYKTGWYRLSAEVFDRSIINLATLIFAFLGEIYTGFDSFSWIIFNLLLVCYNVLLTYFFGGTPGKLFLRLRVLNYSDGERIKLWQAFVRSFPTTLVVIAYFVIFAINDFNAENYSTTGVTKVFAIVGWSWVAIEFITMLFNSKRRAVHDFVARTIVVKTENLGARIWAIPYFLFLMVGLIRVTLQYFCK